jgi:hypothetical protein
MGKLERIYAWYNAGGRLHLPFDVRVEEKRGVYVMTPVIDRRLDEVEREAWFWLAWVMAAFFGMRERHERLRELERAYGWVLEVGAVERIDTHVIKVRIADVWHWKAKLLVSKELPNGAEEVGGAKYESIKNAMYMKTVFEYHKKELEVWLNSLLGEWLQKMVKLREEYLSGWRLQFPVEFIEDGTHVRVVVVDKMTEVALEVCSLIAADMRVKKSEIKVKMLEYQGDSYALLDVDRQYGLRLEFYDAHVDIYTFIDVYQHIGLWARDERIRCETPEKAQLVALMFNYNKREIEERLNAILEKVLE